MAALVLVRHGRPQILEGVHPSKWPLHPDGAPAIEALRSELPIASDATLAASDEAKAIATADVLGHGRDVVVMKAFAEVSKPWFDDPDAHVRAVHRYLAGDDLDGWEPLHDAVARFDAGVVALGNDAPRIVVTHGTVMAAWLASIGAVTDPSAFWSALRMPDAYVLGHDAAR